MARRTLPLVYLFIAIALISGVIIYAYRDITETGIDILIDKKPDLDNNVYAYLFPSPDDNRFSWTLNSIYPFVLNSNKAIINVEIEQEKKYLHIIEDAYSEGCPDNDNDYVERRNYYNFDMVRIISCLEVATSTKPIIILSKDNTTVTQYEIDILSESTIDPTRVPTHKSYITSGDPPDNIIASMENNNIYMRWPSVSQTIRYEIQRRHCNDICNDIWSTIGYAYDDNTGHAEHIDDSKFAKSIQKNRLQYRIRAIHNNGASDWSDTILGIRNMWITSRGIIVDENRLISIIGGTDPKAWGEIFWQNYNDTAATTIAYIYRKTNNGEYDYLNKKDNNEYQGLVVDYNITSKDIYYCYQIVLRNGSNYGIPWPSNGGQCMLFDKVDLDFLSNLVTYTATVTPDVLGRFLVNYHKNEPSGPTPTPTPTITR